MPGTCDLSVSYWALPAFHNNCKPPIRRAPPRRAVVDSPPAEERPTMNDLTYEFQRMISRRAEIKLTTKSDGPQAAWERYSREHGINQQRFKTDLVKLRNRFNSIGSGRE